MVSSRWACLIVAVYLAALSSACAEPPNKELSQAQGALDAARAAGAAEYAAEDFTAASDLLTRAHQAVTERDYRAALSHALESSARAQTAARAAVDGRVKAQLAAEQVIGQVVSAVTHVRTQLATPEAKRMPAGVRRKAEQATTAADAALATARESVAKGNLAVGVGLAPHQEALRAAAASLEPPAAPPRPRGRRE